MPIQSPWPLNRERVQRFLEMLRSPPPPEPGSGEALALQVMLEQTQTVAGDWFADHDPYTSDFRWRRRPPSIHRHFAPRRQLGNLDTFQFPVLPKEPPTIWERLMGEPVP